MPQRSLKSNEKLEGGKKGSNYYNVCYKKARRATSNMLQGCHEAGGQGMPSNRKSLSLGFLICNMKGPEVMSKDSSSSKHLRSHRKRRQVILKGICSKALLPEP